MWPRNRIYAMAIVKITECLKKLINWATFCFFVSLDARNELKLSIDFVLFDFVKIRNHLQRFHGQWVTRRRNINQIKAGKSVQRGRGKRKDNGSLSHLFSIFFHCSWVKVAAHWQWRRKMELWSYLFLSFPGDGEYE